ncbi:uncharacterized protein Triagg1_4001 [Trichoderma aggressivum f. europaeum]|uniref:Uncharacterized protein n=1 Tax=Trichoderma aggressivum f. europaeum TaxID=173218 RepID=A0AAE1IEM1_9HYPO|nr:hypothetical protein Triagg1_4001 [Trichoderma aggressivum f. europaeum]
MRPGSPTVGDSTARSQFGVHNDIGLGEEGYQQPSHSLPTGKDGTRLAYHEIPRRQTHKRSASHSELYHMVKFPMLLSTLVIPLIALVVWLGLTAPKSKLFGSFAGLVIGGRFSQGAAKAIDILCSAIIAPIIMASLNLVWFSYARVAIRASRNVPEEQRRRIPLATLVTISGMSTGSYNFVDFLSLLRGKTWRLFLLTVLTLSSAIGWTTLSNVIAYEAYTQRMPSDDIYTLRTLSDVQINTATHVASAVEQHVNIQFPSTSFGFDIPQQANISEQLTTLLNQMLLLNSSSLDSDGGYVGVNVTDASLNKLSPSVVALYDIPAFRLSATCEPAKLLPGGVGPAQMGASTVELTGILASPNTTSQLHGYWYPGVIADIKDQYSTQFPTVFFSLNYQHAVLGYLQSHEANTSVSTAFGEIQPVELNITAINNVFTSYSLYCSLFRQEGVANYTRSTGQPWELSGSRFQPSKSAARSFIGDWQVALNYHAIIERGTIPGIAPAIRGGLACGLPAITGQIVACETNFSTFVSNFVLASGRAQTMLYNVAATNSSRDRPEYFFDVTGDAMQQFYHLTYVPALLFVSLLSLIIAASAATGMTMYARYIHRDQGMVPHEITPLRLVVDSWAGTLQDAASMTRLASLSNDELQEAAKETYTNYLLD